MWWTPYSKLISIRLASDCETPKVKMFLAEFSAIFTGFIWSFRHVHMRLQAGFYFWFIRHKQAQWLSITVNCSYTQHIYKTKLQYIYQVIYLHIISENVVLNIVWRRLTGPTSIHCYMSNLNCFSGHFKSLASPTEGWGVNYEAQTIKLRYIITI